jgi:hypothetical protein
VADRAVLGFVVVESHHEHIIATDAHPMNLRLRLAISSSFASSVCGVGFAHESILSWTLPVKHHPASAAMLAIDLLGPSDGHNHLASRPPPRASS